MAKPRMVFQPGVDFFFLNLPGVGINANGGCDIANIPGGVLGTADESRDGAVSV